MKGGDESRKTAEAGLARPDGKNRRLNPRGRWKLHCGVGVAEREGGAGETAWPSLGLSAVVVTMPEVISAFRSLSLREGQAALDAGKSSTPPRKRRPSKRRVHLTNNHYVCQSCWEFWPELSVTGNEKKVFFLKQACPFSASRTRVTLRDLGRRANFPHSTGLRCSYR